MEINIKNLNYKNIFENLNLNILENKVTLLAGKSGSGKTTLCNLIYGIYKDYHGEILLDNNVSYLTQSNDALFNINLIEDLTYNLKKYDQKELNELLKMFELDNSILNKNYLEISNSEYKKICIISTFIKNSKIIILDEPTIGLDKKAIQSLIKIIKHTKRKNNIIIIISKDSNFLLEIIDNVIILDKTNAIVIDNKYKFFKDNKLLTKTNMEVPDIIKFNNILLKEKKIKIHQQDNINDLIKEIYRNA